MLKYIQCVLTRWYLYIVVLIELLLFTEHSSFIPKEFFIVGVKIFCKWFGIFLIARLSLALIKRIVTKR